MRLKSIDEFYNDITYGFKSEGNSLLPNGIQKELGQFRYS